MKTKRLRITIAAAGVFTLALGFFAPTAFPFEHATHAYIAEHLGNAEVRENSDAMYAAMAPDFANFVFDFPEHQAYLSDQTHTQFMKVRAVAPRAGLGVWLAYGFLSHNDVWGADSVAHHHGMTFGRDEGYVTAKASLLADILEDYEPYAELGFPREVTEALCQKLVEDGLDILVKGLDPSMGRKITSAAFFRTSDFPVSLVKAHARGLAEARGVSTHEASKFIVEIETEFRKQMMLYGEALGRRDPVPVVARITAGIVVDFLAASQLLPAGIGIDEIAPIVEFGISQSTAICADDLEGEIEATIDFVRESLEANGITWYPRTAAEARRPWSPARERRKEGDMI